MKLSAQFEHSIGVTATGYEIFTLSPQGWHQPPYAQPPRARPPTTHAVMLGLDPSIQGQPLRRLLWTLGSGAEGDSLDSLAGHLAVERRRSEEHTSELQSLMRIS